MTTRQHHTLTAQQQASRRQFFKLLAGSPLVAAAYPALSPAWQRGVEQAWHADRITAAHGPAGACSICGETFALQPSHDAAAVGRLHRPRPSPPSPSTRTSAAGRRLGGRRHQRVGFRTRRPGQHRARIDLRPRRLGPDLAKLDTSTTPFGRRWGTPLFLCPVAALEAYHTEGEAGAARAAKARGILQIQSHQSSQAYETLAEARGEPHWFQLYANQDWDVNKRTLDKVKAAGCPVLVGTVDLLGGSNREWSRRSQGKESYNRPLCLKLVLNGMLTREEAELAVQHGADAVFVSNHGGRAENSLRGTIDWLPEVVAAVKGRVPVMIDSGVRRGGDNLDGDAANAHRHPRPDRPAVRHARSHRS